MTIIPSVRKRFFYTFLASLLRALLSFVTGMLLARFLGPKNYGNMAFLLSTFLALRQFLDMGSAQAFFTFMSQRIRSKYFVGLYFGWIALQFFVTIAVIGLLLPGKWVETIWHGENRGLVLLAFLASFLQNGVWTSVQQLLEAQRLTFKAQGIGTLVVVVHVTAVLILWCTKTIGIAAIFIAIAIEYIIAIAVAQHYFQYAPHVPGLDKKTSRKDMWQMFAKYCTPLVFYSWIAFLYSFLDTWLLQKYGGSVKQAYYAVSSQFSSVALLATSSIANIFYKEIAEAHHTNNLGRMKLVYQKVLRLLFFIGAIISCFLVPWSKDLLKTILGEGYVDGKVTLYLMFLYPIHQSMGQICGSVLFATEHVKTQVKFGIYFMLMSILASYFVLAPSTNLIPGLNLASEGLALKMIILQLAQVNLLAFLISRLFKWHYDWIFQPISIFGCLAAGLISHYIASLIFTNSSSLIVLLGIAGVIYMCLIVLIVYIFPFLTGFSRQELAFEIRKVSGIFSQVK